LWRDAACKTSTKQWPKTNEKKNLSAVTRKPLNTTIGTSTQSQRFGSTIILSKDDIVCQRTHVKRNHLAKHWIKTSFVAQAEITGFDEAQNRPWNYFPRKRYPTT